MPCAPYIHTHSLCASCSCVAFPCRADTSTQGLTNSCGLMVNYQYDLAQVAANNQAYLMEHTIAASEAVQQLLHTS